MIVKPVMRLVRCRSLGEHAAPRVIDLERSHLRVAGVATRVDPTVLLLVALGTLIVGPLRSIGWTLSFVLACLSVELIRARAVARYGGRPGIMLTPVGGLLVGLPCEVAPSIRVKLALAGPALHLGFAALLELAARRLTGTPATISIVLGRMHLVLGVVQLIPAPPFDAGHALEAVLGRRAPAAALAVSLGSIALSGALLFTHVRIVWLGLPLAIAALSTIQSYAQARATEADMKGRATAGIATAQRARYRGDLETAARAATGALGRSMSLPFRYAAADEVALVHVARGDALAAQHILDAHVPRPLHEPLTIAAIALASGKPEPAASVLLAERARGEHRAESTRLLADALVATGQVGEAIRVIVEDQRLLSRDELEQAIDYLGGTERRTARSLLEALAARRGVAAAS